MKVNLTPGMLQGQSVLWTWKESGEEAHNIIHVNTPDSQVRAQSVRAHRRLLR